MRGEGLPTRRRTSSASRRDLWARQSALVAGSSPDAVNVSSYAEAGRWGTPERRSRRRIASSRVAVGVRAAQIRLARAAAPKAPTKAMCANSDTDAHRPSRDARTNRPTMPNTAHKRGHRRSNNRAIRLKRTLRSKAGLATGPRTTGSRGRRGTSVDMGKTLSRSRCAGITFCADSTQIRLPEQHSPQIRAESRRWAARARQSPPKQREPAQNGCCN